MLIVFPYSLFYHANLFLDLLIYRLMLMALRIFLFKNRMWNIKLIPKRFGIETFPQKPLCLADLQLIQEDILPFEYLNKMIRNRNVFDRNLLIGQIVGIFGNNIHHRIVNSINGKIFILLSIFLPILMPPQFIEYLLFSFGNLSNRSHIIGGVFILLGFPFAYINPSINDVLIFVDMAH